MARLVSALMDLELEVNHASMLVVRDLMIQQATAKMEFKTGEDEHYVLLYFQNIEQSASRGCEYDDAKVFVFR